MATMMPHALAVDTLDQLPVSTPCVTPLEQRESREYRLSLLPTHAKMGKNRLKRSPTPAGSSAMISYVREMFTH